jgi:hypothetical protein
VAGECDISANGNSHNQREGVFVMSVRGLCDFGVRNVAVTQFGVLPVGAPLEDEAVFEEEQTFDGIFGWMTVFAGDAG